MSEAVVVYQNFHFAYKHGDTVLKELGLEIKRGSFTVVCGPGGAGKTTLCKTIVGIIPFYYGGRYTGSVLVDGEDTKGKRVSDLAMKVGLMLDDYESQLVSLTAGEEIAFGLINHGFLEDELEERTKTALADVGLAGREKFQLDELSGGQRQRLLLASILAIQPKIIVLDEPVSAMDPQGSCALYELLYKLYRQYGMTVVVVEHDLNLLLPYMTDLIVLNEGRVMAAGGFEEAARKTYEQPALRHLLPTLWRVKLRLEADSGIMLQSWRNIDEALAEIKQKFERRAVR